MPRNLDLTALRSFVTVAETGGVTRAAGFLNLTQSAVSMQLKRLEETLDQQLLDRSSRRVALTAAGEQLLGYAKRMIALNDEAWGRLTAEEFEGEIVLGVPHDIIYPHVPTILRRVAAEFPRIKVRLNCAPSRQLLEMYGRGECDAIITTEDQAGPGGEVIVRLPLRWVGAVDGVAWRREPLPIAFCSNCIFRSGILRVVQKEGLAWDMVVDSDLDNAVEAAVSADLGVTVTIEGQYPRQTAPIDHGGALPDPGDTRIVLYMEHQDHPVRLAFREMIRSTYRSGGHGDPSVQLTA
ncbi:MAG: LysR family transcriptional regulator [Pseudomonadota bacterium]